MSLTISHDAQNDMMKLSLEGYALSLPYTPAGLRALRSILLAQFMQAKPRIATPAAPTTAQVQEMIDTWLRERTERILAAIKLEAELDL